MGRTGHNHHERTARPDPRHFDVYEDPTAERDDYNQHVLGGLFHGFGGGGAGALPHVAARALREVDVPVDNDHRLSGSNLSWGALSVHSRRSEEEENRQQVRLLFLLFSKWEIQRSDPSFMLALAAKGS
ncbi:hypothetical protein JCM6882_002233 [Rhodosporidiobolus microsporus]